jgi:poly(3-hydroxybutyrate) depolymerase
MLSLLCWNKIYVVICCICLVMVQTIGTAPPLPRLQINPQQISISGLSSGADFAVQFHVAYSSVLCGSGIFAGQPFHCAVTKFKNDTLVPSTTKQPGSVPVCEGCPKGQTLIYDHCKNHPDVVDPMVLVNRTLEMAGNGDIDDVLELAVDQIYLYRGTKDETYLKGSVENVAEYFSYFVRNPEAQILFNNTTPSAHCWPLEDYGVPCGFQGVGHELEKCNYDGPGAALNHIYSSPKLLPPAAKSNTRNLYYFDQSPFDADNTVGLNVTGFIYIPEPCMSDSCKLHISLHGCSVNNYYDEAVHELSFNRWAETNRMVVLYPRMAEHGTTVQEKIGCWDAYAQTSPKYDTKDGIQMIAIREMIRRVANV